MRKANTVQKTVVFPQIPNAVQDQLAIETDALNRPIDMVLTAKIQDLRATANVRNDKLKGSWEIFHRAIPTTTLQVPYYKRAGKEENNNSEVMLLKKKALSLSKDLEVSIS